MGARISVHFMVPTGSESFYDCHQNSVHSSIFLQKFASRPKHRIGLQSPSCNPVQNGILDRVVFNLTVIRVVDTFTLIFFHLNGYNTLKIVLPYRPKF